MDERDGRTARKHNAFADTIGWRMHKILFSVYMSVTDCRSVD